ncbi:GntR family transcriptional regulator [Halomonas sp. AOP42-C1-46]|uniref:GntR family transcriptional regulator n=1 Tax=unclassified Halomonas TaxID=2609666 RepID=UPI004034DEA4
MNDNKIDGNRIKAILEERILDRYYVPGVKLNERDLAAEFEVSRTPIRDALVRLQSEGLVEHIPRRGVFVKRSSLRDVLNLLELLALVESSCARLAARVGNFEDKKYLVSKAEEIVEAADAELISEYTKSNQEFHEIIYSMAYNHELIMIVKDVRKKVAPYRKHIHRVAGMTKVSAVEHIDIARAIMNQEEEKAANLMFNHLDMQRKEFAPFVSILGKSLV